MSYEVVGQLCGKGASVESDSPGRRASYKSEITVSVASVGVKKLLALQVPACHRGSLNRVW